VSGWPSRVVGVVAKGQTWLNLVYLLLGFPLGLAYFVALIVGLSVGLALAVVIVGLGILLATLAAWRAFAAVERGLARGLLGVPIPHAPSDRRDLPVVERVRRWLRDPVTWKSLVFVALKFPLGLLSFVVVVCLGGFALILLFAPVIVIWTPVTVFGWIVTSWTEALPLFVAGVPAVLLVLYLCNGLAWLWALFARVMLGPSTVQLHERVDSLRDARARIIAAADAERRRIERDLHDGAQQRLVALSLTLGMAESRLATEPEAAAPLIAQAREEAALAVKELRELASGIHPALLTERGLGPALDALAAVVPVAAAGRVHGLLRHRGGVDQRRQVRGRDDGQHHARGRARTAPAADPRRRRGRRRPDDRQRVARPARPRRGARRPAAHRLPARPRHDPDRRDPARRPAVRRLALVAALALVLVGCGGGPKVTQTRDVGPWTGIEVDGGVNVDVVPGDSGEVVVTGGEEVIDRVRTEVADGVLRISIHDRGIVIGSDPFDDVRVQISAGALDTIRVEGSGDLELGRIDTDELTIEVEGAAGIDASGTVDTLTLNIEGAGDADLGGLEARTARVVVEGAGDAELSVSDELDVTVQGAGDVTYRGNPSVRQRVEGAGEVRPED
jgi:signal transduction histidine kinase